MFFLRGCGGWCLGVKVNSQVSEHIVDDTSVKCTVCTVFVS